MKTFLSATSGQPLGWHNGLLRRSILAACSAAMLCACTVFASDPVGIYALVEKVQFEPAEKPERIIIWGTFTVAEGERGDKYTAPQKGYAYFALPEKKADVAVKEWSDIKSVAGKNEVVGFGTRYGTPAKIRKETEKPKDPDMFRTGFGVVRMNQRGADYPPVKALVQAASAKPKS